MRKSNSIKTGGANHISLPRLRLRARRFEHLRSNYAGSLYLCCNPCEPVSLCPFLLENGALLHAPYGAYQLITRVHFRPNSSRDSSTCPNVIPFSSFEGFSLLYINIVPISTCLAAANLPDTLLHKSCGFCLNKFSPGLTSSDSVRAIKSIRG